MDRPGRSPGHSLKNKFAAHEPYISLPFFFRWIEFLSIYLSAEEILELSRQFRGCPDAELHRLATDFRRHSLALSQSQRSSSLSNFSRQSILSSSSLHSHDSAPAHQCPVEQGTLEIEHKWHDSYPASQPAAQVTSLPTSLQPAGLVLYNQDSPPHSSQALPTRKPFCFACNEQFINKGSLTRHQKEQCERKKISVCTLCPPPQPMYYTDERLFRHHFTSHRDQCRHGCSKNEKISTHCKDHLSKSFEELPVKKAWGCPYCVSCFQTFEKWHEHCTDHFGKADKAPKWCFGTMLWSLLQQDALRDARMRHDMPVTENWSTVNEKTCPGLREILEHCKLPSRLRTPEYWYLDDSNAVVRCVYNHISRGESLASQQLFEPRSKHMPCHSSSSAVEVTKDLPCASEPFLPHRKTDSAVKALLYSHDRTDHAYMTPHLASRKAHCASQPQFSVTSDAEVSGRPRHPEMSDTDDTADTNTRKRAPSLKRSVSNLALRPSPSRSPAIQTVAEPPVPPLPRDARSLTTDRAAAGIHHEGSWSAAAYLDASPHHRPMSGVVYNDWSWPDGNQSINDDPAQRIPG